MEKIDAGFSSELIETNVLGTLWGCAAAAAVMKEGKSVTYDMKPHRDDPTAVGTSQVGDAIIEKMREL